MPSFQPDKSLLNAKFEGYKLDAIEQDAVLSRLKLEHPLRQSSTAGKSPLTFHEVQSRIRHNHLTVGPDGSAVYIDSELRVVRIAVNDTEINPKFEVVFEIPNVLQSADTDGPHREYPSAAFLDTSTLLVSDGNGTLYTLQIGQTGQATLLNSYELKIPAEYKSLYSSVPFRIHLAKHGLDNTCVALLSARHYAAPSDESSADTVQARVKKLPPKFDIWAVGIDLDQVAQDQAIPLDIQWHRQGEDVPSYVSYVESKATLLLIGSSPYRPLSSPNTPQYDPTPEEIAPIPRADESLDTSSPPKPPPYSWTQTGDSVTVAFPVPSDTQKNAIKVTLSTTTLTVLIQSDKEPSTVIPLPHFTLKKFWDSIHTATSFWTFDRQAEQKYGLLTLHLDKAHEGTKWTHLFAGQETSNEPEVPETLDPSELYAIRESLEKYTAALQTGEDASGLGLGRAVPSLAEGELDDEVDIDTGEAVVATWVALDGSTPQWGSSDSPFTLLAIPLPTSEPQVPSVVAKNGLDGLVYTACDTGEEVSWTHSSTFNALSFVLASKRDTRFVYVSSGGSVLAFESGARGLGGNVYIYRKTARIEDKFAKQAVLKIGDVSSGPLLGVGQVKTKGGKTITLCLCERELSMIRDTV